MYSANLVSALNDIANRYRSIVYQAIHSVLSQPPYKNTGAGAASLTVDVISGNESSAPQLVISFDDHLIYINQRKMQWTRWPDMRNLIEWAETKKATRQEAENLAFAVGYEKKTNDTWKAKPWRKKTLSGVLKEMNALILTAFDEAINKDFEEAINRA